jgi:DNA replication initiation complex subunit (GINS family)
MSNIKISELQPTGLELFQDCESFINELTDQEIGSIKGGIDTYVNFVVVNSTQVQQSQRELTPEEKKLLDETLQFLNALF